MNIIKLDNVTFPVNNREIDNLAKTGGIDTNRPYSFQYDIKHPRQIILTQKGKMERKTEELLTAATITIGFIALYLLLFVERIF